MLNLYHGKCYRVYNLCSEKAYDPERFRLGDVVSFPMDDHEVPPLPMLFEFVRCDSVIRQCNNAVSHSSLNLVSAHVWLTHLI